MACNSKMASRRAKRSTFWDSRALIQHVWATFDLLVFKVILGSFGVLVSKWPVSGKSLAVEWQHCPNKNQTSYFHGSSTEVPWNFHGSFHSRLHWKFHGTETLNFLGASQLCGTSMGLPWKYSGSLGLYFFSGWNLSGSYRDSGDFKHY